MMFPTIRLVSSSTTLHSLQDYILNIRLENQHLQGTLDYMSSTLFLAFFFLRKRNLHLGVENVWVGALSYRTRQQCCIFPIGRHNQETPLFLWGQCSASWAKINMASGRAILNISGPPAGALQNTAHGLHPLSHVSCILGSMCWFEMLMSRPFFYYSGALLKVYRHH